jgi:hypothetical protein
VTNNPLVLDASAHAPGWPEVAQLLPPTLSIETEISSAWAIVALIALSIWLNRRRR